MTTINWIHFTEKTRWDPDAINQAVNKVFDRAYDWASQQPKSRLLLWSPLQSYQWASWIPPSAENGVAVTLAVRYVDIPKP